MTKKELKKILRNHLRWLKDKRNGKRADLRYADLRYADLSNANLEFTSLRSADLNGANLINIKLWGADLCNANLEFTSLRGADLSGADLNSASLIYTDLSNADLRGANLRFANLNGAKLNGADLRDADLRYAVLNGADLDGAKLRDTTLWDADLYCAQNIPFIRMACPDTGSFIGWKYVNNYIIKLEIPADAKRCSATTGKCRCEFAKVLEIQNLDGTKADIEETTNFKFVPDIVYKVGEIVYPDSFDTDRWNECSNGIHFFINRQEAVEYNM